MTDGDETDVDCGGATCGKCTSGKACVADGDCTTGACSLAGKCTNPCADGKVGGLETDVDCGGATCGKCTNGKACSVAGDCVSNTCSGNVCTSCLPPEDATPLAGQTVVLSQFKNVTVAGYDRVAVSPSGKNVYWVRYWNGTMVYARDASTGNLTELQELGWPQGGSGATFFQDTLYFGSWSSPRGLIFVTPSAVDGTLPTAKPATTVPPGYTTDIGGAASVGPYQYFHTNDKTVRRVANGAFDPNVAVAAGANAVRNPRRFGDSLVWHEVGSNAAIRRAKVECDGSLSNVQSLPSGGEVEGIAACASTGRIYVTDKSDPNLFGAVYVIDTNACPSDLSTCAKKKVVSSQTVPTLTSLPGEVAVSPDCSMLFVGGEGAGEIVTFNVFSLADPDNPTLIRAFTGKQTYDGVPLGDPASARFGQGLRISGITVTAEAVYHAHAFGSGIAVYRFVP